MTSVDEKTRLQIMTDYLYGLPAGADKNQGLHHSQSYMEELAPSIMMGVPITLGLVGLPQTKFGKALGRPFSAWMYQRKNPTMPFSIAYNHVTTQAEKEAEALKYLTKDSGIFSGMANKRRYNAINRWGTSLPTVDTSVNVANLQGKELLKYQNNVIKSGHYDEARRLIQEAKDQKMTGKALKEQMAKILDAMRKGDIATNYAKRTGAIKPTSLLGKASHVLKKGTGYYALKGGALKCSKNLSAGLRAGASHLKGGGLFAVIGLALSIPELKEAWDADSANEQEGKKSKHFQKQLLKTGAKVGASVLGYAAGAAAAGAAVGSIFPGVGTAIGAAVGFVGGVIGSFFAEKAVSKVFGKDGDKSEGQIYAAQKQKEAEEASKALAKNAGNSQETQDALLQSMASAIESGQVDSKEVIKAFEEQLKERENSVALSDGTLVNKKYADDLQTLSSLNIKV